MSVDAPLYGILSVIINFPVPSFCCDVRLKAISRFHYTCDMQMAVEVFVVENVSTLCLVIMQPCHYAQ